MYYVLSLICILIFTGALFCLRKKLKGNVKFEKTLAVVFAAVFAARYYSYVEYPISHIYGLSGGADGRFMTALSLISVWLAATSCSILMLKPFFGEVGQLKTLVKYFCLPSYALAIALTDFNVRFLTGGMPDGFGFTAAAYAIENALAFSICAYEWIKEPRFDKPDRSVWTTIAALLAMIVCTFPSYGLQVLFGKGSEFVFVDEFTPIHRAFLYFAFIIPAVIYFVFRNKEYAVRRFAMTYMSIALMITFCTRYKYDSFLEPWRWPLHLCNTAMFIVPICLVFNMKRLFYFTYFINVMGAFLAMAMPNYTMGVGGVTFTEWTFVNFWVNHYPAFFMPLLLVALGIFEKPKIKQFYHSMAWFFVYFVLVLILNPLFTAMGHEVDFFFLNSDFIADKHGVWAQKLFQITATVKIGGMSLEFHPLYQLLFYLVYVAIAFAIWFVYEQFFAIAEVHRDMYDKKKQLKAEKIALKAALNGRDVDQPVNIGAGTSLVLKKFSKRYALGKNYAVKDADLTVRGGEIFGFLGPNGAGKSTIIKSIVGIQPITEGAIEVCGYDVATQSRKAKERIGFVPDHYALYEQLTGREYINYIADVFGVSREDRNERIERMVKLFELEGSFDCSMKTYSHGMKQKITIMAALVHDPRLWILDEPLTGLDPNSIFQVKECMRRHAEAGNVVFFSSHIIDVVERICDRIAIIKKGKILCVRTIAEIEEICPLEEFYMKMINDDEFAARVMAENGEGGVRK